MSMMVTAEAKQRLEAFLESLCHRLRDLSVDIDFTVDYQDDHIRIDMTGVDSDGFLQKRAEALNALQHLLRKSMERPGDPETPIVLDSHGYRLLRERELAEMARSGCEQAKATREGYTLGPLNPYERRIVHIACQRSGGVVTRSLGDGFLKRIVISSDSAGGSGGRS